MKLTKANFKKLSKNLLPYCILLLVCALLMIPLATGFSLHGHDILYHLQAINSLDVAYNNGSFFSKIYELICQDYGYGTGIFYSMIPAGIAILLKNWFNISALAAISVEFGAILFISGSLMYFFLLKVTKNKKTSLLLAIFYVIFPYNLSNIYIRFAFTEVFFTFLIPIIFISIYELLEEKNYLAFSVLFIIGYSLAIIIHIAYTIYLTLFVAIYLLIRYKDFFNKKNLIIFAISTFIVLLISATFYIPMLISQKDINISNMGYDGSFLYKTLLSPFFSESNLFLKFSMIIILVSYILYLIDFIINRKKNTKAQKQFFIFSTILIFSISPLAVFWFIIGNTILNLIQFVWRLYLICGFVVIFQLLQVLPKMSKKLFKNLFIGFYCCVSAFGLVIYTVPYANNTNKSFNSLVNTFSTNNGMGSSKKGDYLPKNANNEYIFNRVNEKIILETNTKVEEFANYQSLNQIHFVVYDTESNYVVINIPYDVCEGIKVYQYQSDEPFTKAELEYSSYEVNGLNCLKIEFEDMEGESKITLDYSNCELLKNYLIKNPFEFLVKSGDIDAKFTNFVKENSHTYTVEIDVRETTKIELPTLYYSGYKVMYTTSTSTYELNEIRNENGFVEIEVTESGKLFIEFKPTYITVSNIISVIGFMCFITFVSLLYMYEKNLKIEKDKHIGINKSIGTSNNEEDVNKTNEEINILDNSNDEIQTNDETQIDKKDNQLV